MGLGAGGVVGLQGVELGVSVWSLGFRFRSSRARAQWFNVEGIQGSGPRLRHSRLDVQVVGDSMGYGLNVFAS